MLLKVVGSKVRVVEALRFSTDPVAVAFLESWDSISKTDLDSLSLEAICVHAEVNPAALLGAVLIATRNIKGQESALRAMIAHPDVVNATIKTAKMAGRPGDAARQVLHTAVGFLPTKQGQNINVNLMGNSPQLTAPDDDDHDDDNESFAEAFPSISENLESWGDNRRKLLEAGKK